jgi:hypothetical protein
MVRIRHIAAAILAVSALAATPAPAQCTGTDTCSTTSSTSLTIGALLNLEMSSTTTTLTPPTIADLAAGFVADAGPTFIVQANQDWTLAVKAAASNGTNWTYAGTKGGVKAIGDLTWSATVGGAFVAMTGANVTVATAAASTAGTAAAIFFRTTYAPSIAIASNRPGVYTLPLVFTLSAP